MSDPLGPAVSVVATGPIRDMTDLANRLLTHVIDNKKDIDGLKTRMADMEKKYAVVEFKSSVFGFIGGLLGRFIPGKG